MHIIKGNEIKTKIMLEEDQEFSKRRVMEEAVKEEESMKNGRR